MSSAQTHYSVTSVAKAFVNARAASAALPEYPGSFPPSLADAYATQDKAIDLWSDKIGGWKVGRIPDPYASELGADRLIGPIFSSLIRPADEAGLEMDIFSDGFAAVEAEFILEVGKDAPADKLNWTDEEALSMIRCVRAGVEVASSPLPSINDHGPLVTISDFGNNFGLIVGPELEGLLSRPLEEWVCEVLIDGEPIGHASAAGLPPGGAVGSLRYALENAAGRGRPLRAGMMVSTGAVTGVHQVGAGQTAENRFVGGTTLRCHFVPLGANSHAAE